MLERLLAGDFAGDAQVAVVAALGDLPEVELPEATRPIVERIEAFNPERLVLDSLSEFRLLAQDERFFRRQLLALKEYLAQRGCTTLMLDARAKTSGDVHVHRCC